MMKFHLTVYPRFIGINSGIHLYTEFRENVFTFARLGVLGGRGEAVVMQDALEDVGNLSLMPEMPDFASFLPDFLLESWI